MSKETVVVKIRKILVGIDGSAYSLKALDFAFELAKKYDAMLIALTVFHIPEIYKTFQNKENYNTISIEDEILKSKNLLKAIKDSGDTNMVNTSIEFMNSKSTPDIALLEYSQRNDIDHIVLGYRGRTIENLLIGNIATSVVSKSKCSVTVVK